VYMNAGWGSAGLPGPTRLRHEHMRVLYRQWQTTLAPCHISHVDIYNPCLPEDFDGHLTCLTCGLRQVLELPHGTLEV
jgi:hypothetical protein